MSIDDKTFQTIIIDMANGLSVKKALVKHGVSQHDFFKEMDDNPEKWNSYDNAQRAKAHSFVDEIPDIADNEPDVSRAKLSIDARRYYSSKIIPAKYGDRIDININKTIDIKQALMDAKQRVIDVNAMPLIPLRDLGIESKSQDVELIDESASSDTGYRPEMPLKNDDDIFS